MSSRLNALMVSRVKEPGRYTDAGSGLILQVAKGAGGDIKRSWLARYQLNGKRREMGLGAYPEIKLSQARERALDIRKQLAEGVDPIEARRIVRAEEKAKTAQTATFRDCAEGYIASHEPSWSNPKHRQQWRNTLKTYAYPIIGGQPVRDITVDHIMEIVEPIWHNKTETASRVRGRIEAILSWAIVRGLRDGPNPAVWRGHLDALLPPRSRVQRVTHRPALDWEEMPNFFAKLQQRSAPAARALEFTILTAARSSEVRFARWNEIDFKKKVWTVPAARIKTRREHRAPLSDCTISLLNATGEQSPDKFIFSNNGKPFSDSAYRALFIRMGVDGITTHGFRSTFRDWCGEKTTFPREIAEAALAHHSGNAVERAYRRGDALEKRRTLMQAWSDYCARKD